jgi:nucleoid DNA-binding protein
MPLQLNVDKRTLWQYVNRKFKGIIHHYHVLAVITILFEEMISDLKQGKQIDIFNLGTLSLKQMKPRQYHDVRHRRMMHAQGRRVLRFSLSSKIRKKLCDNLDIDKTLKGG